MSDLPGDHTPSAILRGASRRAFVGRRPSRPTVKCERSTGRGSGFNIQLEVPHPAISDHYYTFSSSLTLNPGLIAQQNILQAYFSAIVSLHRKRSCLGAATVGVRKTEARESGRL